MTRRFGESLEPIEQEWIVSEINGFLEERSGKAPQLEDMAAAKLPEVGCCCLGGRRSRVPRKGSVSLVCFVAACVRMIFKCDGPSLSLRCLRTAIWGSQLATRCVYQQGDGTVGGCTLCESPVHVHSAYAKIWTHTPSGLRPGSAAKRCPFSCSCTLMLHRQTLSGTCGTTTAMIHSGTATAGSDVCLAYLTRMYTRATNRRYEI